MTNCSGKYVTFISYNVQKSDDNFELNISHSLTSLVSVTQLTVTVDDRNDNRPMFSADLIRRTLSESEEVGPVFTFPATDSDEGTNSAVLYSIMDEFGKTLCHTVMSLYKLMSLYNLNISMCIIRSVCNCFFSYACLVIVFGIRNCELFLIY